MRSRTNDVRRHANVGQSHYPPDTFQPAPKYVRRFDSQRYCWAKNPGPPRDYGGQRPEDHGKRRGGPITTSNVAAQSPNLWEAVLGPGRADTSNSARKQESSPEVMQLGRTPSSNDASQAAPSGVTRIRFASGSPIGSTACFPIRHLHKCQTCVSQSGRNKFLWIAWHSKTGRPWLNWLRDPGSDRKRQESRRESQPHPHSGRRRWEVEELPIITPQRNALGCRSISSGELWVLGT